MNHSRPDHLPPPRWRRPLEPVIRFLHAETTPGVLLALAAAVALIMANSPFAESWTAFWNIHFKVAIGSFALDYPLWYWVNDALMAIFFFLIGLEIKRELVHGELSDPKAVVLPVAAAFGGAALPALIYVFLHGSGPEGLRGWAVPMATDIAFVVGCMALLGRRVPIGLKVFLLTLAIVDDIIAVAVIAVFYTADLNIAMLVSALVGLGVILLMQWGGVRSIAAYSVVGALIWLATFKGGVHPTIAAVILGLLTPASSMLKPEKVREILRKAVSESDDALAAVEDVSRESVSPLDRLMVMLHPWVMLVIMPVFALANAGVEINLSTLSHPVALGVALGLFVGKPVGIAGMSFIVVRAGFAKLPAGVNWATMVGAGALAGIGFTMSMFIANLGMRDSLLIASKGGIILGSACSAILGMTLLIMMLRAPAKAEDGK